MIDLKGNRCFGVYIIYFLMYNTVFCCTLHFHYIYSLSNQTLTTFDNMHQITLFVDYSEGISLNGFYQELCVEKSSFEMLNCYNLYFVALFMLSQLYFEFDVNILFLIIHSADS